MKMTISQVARLAGVGVETVRFYEREGLLDQPLVPRPAIGSIRSMSSSASSLSNERKNWASRSKRLLNCSPCIWSLPPPALM